MSYEYILGVVGQFSNGRESRTFKMEGKLFMGLNFSFNSFELDWVDPLGMQY